MKTSKDFAMLVMNEVGLCVDKTGTIIDQDTGRSLQFKGKNMKLSNGYINHNDISFEPLKNLSMMNIIFSYFGQKIMNETGMYIKMVYHTREQDNKGRMSCICEFEDGHCIELTSKSYIKDTVKFLNLIMLINNPCDDTDLTEYDNIEW